MMRSLVIIFVVLVQYLRLGESFQGSALRRNTASKIFNKCRRANPLSAIESSVDSIKESDQSVSELDSKKTEFQWEKQWYPVGVDEIMDRTKPHSLQILGNDVVLWHDGETWRAFEDSCPHRGVPLSEGRVEKSGELLCAYHAWTWDGEGHCTKIPQSKNAEKMNALIQSPSSCAKVYPSQVLEGKVWVWGEKGAPGSDVALQAALKKPRLIEELWDPKYEGRIRKVMWTFRDLPYGWDMFMENTLDPAHVPVSHHGIVGNRYRDATYIYHERVKSRSEIPISEGGELDPRFPEDAGFNHRIINPANNGTSTAFNDFRPPCLNKITQDLPGGGKTILALYATPTKPGFSRHIGAQILIEPEAVDGKKPAGLGVFGLPLPAWLLHAMAPLFLHQDQVFLHHQERMLYSSSNYAFGRFDESFNLTSDPKAFSSTYYMPNEQDQQINKFRKWIAEKAAGGPRWGRAALAQGLPKRLPPAELFNAWESHGKHCLICQGAVRNLKIVRNVAAVAAFVSGVMIKNKVKALVLSAVLGLVSLLANKFRGLYHSYEFSHQNNN